jgi:hypothetical protein
MPRLNPPSSPIELDSLVDKDLMLEAARFLAAERAIEGLTALPADHESSIDEETNLVGDQE